jgi:hypothetical protein
MSTPTAPQVAALKAAASQALDRCSADRTVSLDTYYQAHEAWCSAHAARWKATA